ncbi:MAG: hypothetical protein LC745_04015 [Planctomycetia bacterium]|nr:hypothetical protein [Planctomycetia bacterium]
MKNSRAFTPGVTESLETRSVPSVMGLPRVHAFTLSNGLAVSRVADVVAPAQSPPGTFFQGSAPGVSTAGGSLFTMRAAPMTVAHAATSHDEPTTPAHFPAGTFFQGGAPGVSTAGGSLFTLRGFHRH